MSDLYLEDVEGRTSLSVPEGTKSLIEAFVRDGASPDQLTAYFGKSAVEAVAKTDPDIFEAGATGVYQALERGNDNA